jgi:hypothetical protein
MKAGRYFAGAALLVLPFIFGLSGSEQMRDPKVRFLAVMFGFWLAHELWRKVHPALGCALAGLLLSAALRSITFPLHQTLAITAAFGSCLWVRRLSENEIQHGLKLLEISGVLVAFYAAVLQFGGIDPILTYLPGHRPMAFFGQHTLYGPFAVACFASALFGRRHIRALLLLTPIPLIDSSFTYLALAVVIFFYGICHFGRRALLGALLVCLAAVGVSKMWPKAVEDTLNDQGRFHLWKHTVRLSNGHWLAGHGLASFRLIYPIFQDPALRKANGIEDKNQSPEMQRFILEADFLRRRIGPFMHPHNEPLLVYFEFGALGLLIALWLVAVFAWYWLQMPDEPWAWALGAIFFSSLANAQGSFNLHLIPQALLPLWALVAVTSRPDPGTLEEDAYPS